MGEPAPTDTSAIPPAGTSSGLVLVFDIPLKGTNVTVSQVLEQHRDAITDIAAELGQAPVRGDQRCGRGAGGSAVPGDSRGRRHCGGSGPSPLLPGSTSYSASQFSQSLPR